MTDIGDLAARIEASWAAVQADSGAAPDAEAVETAIAALDAGQVRIAEPRRRLAGG